jgi:hypothetical protein
MKSLRWKFHNYRFGIIGRPCSQLSVPRRLEDEFSTMKVNEDGGFGNENQARHREVAGLSRGTVTIRLGGGPGHLIHGKSFGRMLDRRVDAYCAAHRGQETRGGQNEAMPPGRSRGVHDADRDSTSRENTISGYTTWGEIEMGRYME